MRAINLLCYAPVPYLYDYLSGSTHNGEPSSPSASISAALKGEEPGTGSGLPASYVNNIYGPDHGWREGSYCCNVVVCKKIYATLPEGFTPDGNVWLFLDVTGADGSEQGFSGSGVTFGMNRFPADAEGVFVTFPDNDIGSGGRVADARPPDLGRLEIDQLPGIRGLFKSISFQKRVRGRNIMILCYNLTRQLMVDADNCRINTKPSLFFGERPVWELRFLEGEPGSAGTASDLSHIVSYRVAIDTDWNSATEPMCRTVEGIDKSRAAEGVLLVPVNANTQNYLSKIEAKSRSTRRSSCADSMRTALSC